MFESIQRGLGEALKKLRGRGRLTEANIRDGLQEVRRALLDADVNFTVANDFIQRVTERAVGQAVLRSLDPSEQIVRVVYDELVNLMGPVDHGFHFAKDRPTVIMLCGLQGSGKTTTAGKLALALRERGRKPLLVAADLQIDNLEGLGQLRLLWSLRPSRPWDSWSRAVMVFDLAADADSSRKLLGRYPDLLLVDEADPPIYICGWGLVFQEVLFTERPRRIEMKARRQFERKQYELLIGDHRFPMPGDASAVVHRLERWFRYHLSDFVPQVKNVYAWKAPAGTKPLPARQTVLCEDCQRLIIPVPGEVGVLVDPARKRKR